MKYVIIKAGEREYPIIFPAELVHKDVSIYIMTLLRNNHGAEVEGMRVSGAGFINSADVIGPAYGKSESLDIGSQPDDTNFIRTVDYNHGHREGTDFILQIMLKSIEENQKGPKL